jgi:hypothetical protein
MGDGRKARVLTLQRQRRNGKRRLDYYPNPDAVAVIDSQRHGRRGGDASSIINRIIGDWQKATRGG